MSAPLDLLQYKKFSEDFAKCFVNPFSPPDYSKMSDAELIEILKKDPNYEKYVYPSSWHKKFPDLPKADCSDPKQYIRESPWMKKAYVMYDQGGKPIHIEAKPGGNRPILEAPEIPVVTLIENNFSDKDDSTNQSAPSHPLDSQKE